MALDPETRELLLATVQRFVMEKLRPIEDEVAENDAIPEWAIADMREMGLFGLTIPEEYGGLNLSMEDECHVIFHIGKASPAFRSEIASNLGIGSQGLVMFGTEAQKQKYLPSIASGELITSFALTEPEAGSDSASVKTHARREGDEYVINGSKRYITNAGKAGLFTVMVRTNPEQKGGRGVSAILVPGDAPGLSVGKAEKKMGQQGAHIHDVYFEDVRVPVENRLGEEGEGFRIAMQVLDKGRLHIAAMCVGVAERLITDCVAYASERKQFGKPIADFQLVQAMIADSKAECLAARALVLETARKRDAKESIVLEAASAKYFASEMVGRVADRAVQIHGGAGYVADYGIERLYRDVRIFRIFEGTSQIQQLVIARETIKQGG